MERTIVQNFNNFRGRDVRSSDFVRNENFAIEFENARVVREDSVVTREGFKIRSNEGNYKGLYTYKYSDPVSGETVEEVISLGEFLLRKINSSVEVRYAGAGAAVDVSHTLDTETGTYVFEIELDGVVVVSEDVGTGNEVSPYTLGDLKTIVDAVTSFTLVINSESSSPAAFLPILVRERATPGATDTLIITSYYWEAMNTLDKVTFDDYNTAYAEDYFEFASTRNIDNCLYIATGYNYLYKYDGQNVYRAGLPFPETDPVASIAGTGFTDTAIRYIYLYKQVDNRGNIITSVASDPSNSVSPANDTVSIVVANILDSTEFNTGHATVNGAQVGVTTITVDSTRVFKIGDIAYFLDSSSGQYVEREIEFVDATTLEISGAAVNVADNAVISNNLRIVIYRSTASGSLFYKVAEIPNDALNATQTYADALAIANLGTQYIAPVFDHDPLEIFPKYIATHQGLLVAAGDPEFPNTWFYSSGDGPEYFPALSNFEEVRNTSSGGIKGIGSDEEFLAIGTERSIHVFSGDLASGIGRFERLNGSQMGFASHNSIVDIEDGIIFLGKTGFWLLQNGYNLIEIGEPINPEIINIIGLSSAALPILRRSTAVYFEETDEYICFVPTESGEDEEKYVNNSAVAHVLTVKRPSWGTYTGLNMGGGITIADSNIFFQSRRFNSSLDVSGDVWERNTLGKLEDYADHENPIVLEIGTQWINAGEPSLFKVFLWLKVFNLLRSVLSASFTLSVRVERDYRRGQSWFNFELPFGSGENSLAWGLFPWGLSVWGGEKTEAKKMKLKSGKAQALRYIFSCRQLNKKVTLSGWETEYSNPYALTIKD